MPNVVFVVGLGPGDPRFLTAQAQSALTQAEVLCGYTVYLDLVRPYFPDKFYYSTGMTKEIDRCRWALDISKNVTVSDAVGRWKRPGAAGRWRWSAREMPGSTAWQALCWSWPSTSRT